MEIKLKTNEVMRVRSIFDHNSSFYYGENVVYEIVEELNGFKFLKVSVLNSKGLKEMITAVTVKDWCVQEINGL